MINITYLYGFGRPAVQTNQTQPKPNTQTATPTIPKPKRKPQMFDPNECPTPWKIIMISEYGVSNANQKKW